MADDKKRPSTEPTKQAVEGKEKGAGNTLSTVLYTTNEGLSTHLEHFPIGIIEKKCKLCGKNYIRYAGREYAWGECCSYTCHKRMVYAKEIAHAKPVAQFTKDANVYIRTFQSAVDAAYAVGAKNADGIRDCCNGKTKSSCGFYWRWRDYCDGLEW